MVGGIGFLTPFPIFDVVVVVVVCVHVSCRRAGCHFKFWVADWFAQLNNKMGGDLKKIQVTCFFLNH